MPTETLHTDPLFHAVEYLRQAGEWVSFWSAVTLPFVTTPLVLTGLSTTGETVAFVALVAANVLALFFGRGYGEE